MHNRNQYNPGKSAVHFRIAVFAIGLAGLMSCGRRSQPSGILLENDLLKIELSPDRPLVRSLIYKPSNRVFGGDDGSTGWVINGHLYPWSEWKIDGTRDQRENRQAYRLSLPALQIGFDYTLSLGNQGLEIGLDSIDDPGQRLKSISWGERSLVNTTDPSMQWWTRQTAMKDHPWVKEKVKNRGLWTMDEYYGRVGDSVSKESTIDACLWYRHQGVVTALVSNTDVLPIRLQGGPGKGFSMGLNDWNYRLAGHIMPDLKATVLFLGDLNGDSLSDDRDYFYWKNRQLADVSDTIRGSIAFKVFMDAPTLAHPSTTLDQLDVMLKAIHNLTDGLPQIAYLVGWQYRGHDTGYPAIDQWNERLGSHDKFLGRVPWYRDHLNTCISYHINIDDTYPGNNGFDPALMATDYDGAPMFWEVFHNDTAFHASHYKDWQSGAVTSRLKAFMKTVPVREILHIDAMRTINCNPAWEKDSIGVAAELDLGLRPILQWLNKQGIAVTTEAQNGMPHYLTGLVAGVWHLDDPTVANIMTYHRKLVGGGLDEGRGKQECGLGTSLHEDLSYASQGGNPGFKEHWPVLKERIFLGSLLYLYYLQRQLTNVTKTADGWVLKFDDSTMTTIDTKSDHLLVTRGDLVIARDDDRFVPVGGGIYVFSKKGGIMECTLPENFRGKPLEVFTLTENGRRSAQTWNISGNRIRLSLGAGIPVKITLKNS